MKLGKFKITTIDTSIFGLDGGAMFGVVPKVMWAKNYHPGDDKNRIPLQARTLLIQWGNKKVLVDTGNGDKYSDKFAEIYNLDRENCLIEHALALHDIKPEQITDVILTHLHFDHAGGGTKRIDNHIYPTFPKAKYFIQKENLKWANSSTVKDKASFISDDYMPLIADGLLETIDGPGELFPGIELITVDGHTKNMQLVKVTENGKTILFCADLLATSAHVHIPFVMGYDNYPLTTIEEKKQILPRAFEEQWIMVYQHDAFAVASKIALTDKGFRAGEILRLNDDK